MRIFAATFLLAACSGCVHWPGVDNETAARMPMPQLKPATPDSASSSSGPTNSSIIPIETTSQPQSPQAMKTPGPAPSSSSGNSVTLDWNAADFSNLAGYRLYSGGASRSYTNVIGLGRQTNCTVSGLISGALYYFAVTSYSSNGMESAYSSEAHYLVPLPGKKTPAKQAGPAPVP